jgi:hypothetical protein
LDVTQPQETQQESMKSSVKINLNSKGNAQPEVKCYEGVTEEEMARLGTLALETFNAVIARLGARANFS